MQAPFSKLKTPRAPAIDLLHISFSLFIFVACACMASCFSSSCYKQDIPHKTNPVWPLAYSGIDWIFVFVIHTYTPTPPYSQVMAQHSKRLILSYIFDWIVIMFVLASLIHSALLIVLAQSPELQEEFLSQPLIIDPFHHKIWISPIRMSMIKSRRQY